MRQKVLFSSVAVLAIAWGAPVYAQAADADTTGFGDDDIIVTAQRRSERLENVPMSITAVSAERIQSVGATSLRDLSGVVPGFQLAASGVFVQPALRGVSSTVSGYFESNVGVYVDGLYQSAPLILNVDLPNVASVEVLKGPQGTLYGRNATGGVVLLNTLDPTDTLQGKAEITYARFNDRRANGYISGPIADRVSVSLAGSIRRSDGDLKLASRTTPGATDGNAAPLAQNSVRAKVKFDVSSNFTAQLWVGNTYLSDTRTNLYTPDQNVSQAILTNASYVLGTVPGGRGTYAANPKNEGSSKQTEVGLKLELTTGIGTLQSITGYADTKSTVLVDFDGTFSPGVYVEQIVDNYTFQQTLDYNIDAIEGLNLNIGGMYVDGVLRGASDTFIGGANTATNPGTAPLSLTDPTAYVLLVDQSWRTHRKAWAGYVDATLNVSDRIFINIGGRYSRESLTGEGAQASFLASLVRNPISVSTTFKKFTPRASIRYEFDPRSSIYVSYSQGFRGGNYNNATPPCVNVNPTSTCYQPAEQEEITAYEAGFKISRPGFRFDLAGFYYDYTNLQITSLNAGPPVSTVLANAPKAKIYGMEANVMFQPVDNLTVTAGATWLHARYGDGFLLAGAWGVNPSQPGLNTNADVLRTYTNVSQVQDLSGLMMTRAPNFSGNLGMTYRVPQDEGGWDFSANARFTSSYVPSNPHVWGNAPGVPLNRQREQRFLQSGYTIVNASVTWTHPGGNYYARAWANNLTDKQFILNQNNSTFGTYTQISEPRTFGGTIGFKF